jgi:hypothetical protein
MEVRSTLMLVDSEDRGESVGAIGWVDLESRCSGSAKAFHAEIARGGRMRVSNAALSFTQPPVKRKSTFKEGWIRSAGARVG